MSRIVDASFLCLLAIGTLAGRVRRLHRDQTGAEEGMNKLLIFAMVALPLLALLIFFGGEIVTFAEDQFESVFGGGGVPMR